MSRVLSPSDHVATQVRLVLETQCAEIGRDLVATLGDEGSFMLWLADFGEPDTGNLAWFSNASLDASRRAVARWVREGLVRVVVVGDSGEELRRSLRGLAEGLRARCPAGVGYALLIWLDDEPLAYVSTADREDVQRLAMEWLVKSPRGGTPA